MKSASLSLVVGLMVATTLHHSVAFWDPDPWHPEHTCIYACNPDGLHGCRDACPVCDPIKHRCVPKDGGGDGLTTTTENIAETLPTSPPTRRGKCIGYVKVNVADVLRIREKPTLNSRIFGTLKGQTHAEFSAKVYGDSVNGNSEWLRLRSTGAYVAAVFIQLKGKLLDDQAPDWCEDEKWL